MVHRAGAGQKPASDSTNHFDVRPIFLRRGTFSKSAGRGVEPLPLPRREFALPGERLSSRLRPPPAASGVGPSVGRTHEVIAAMSHRKGQPADMVDAKIIRLDWRQLDGEE